MFISFVWGVLVRGVFGKGGFCPGAFCPGAYVRGVFVLIPQLKVIQRCSLGGFCPDTATESHLEVQLTSVLRLVFNDNCTKSPLNFHLYMF